MALEFDPCSQGWGDVYATGDPNQTYETFLSTFMALYQGWAII